MYVDVLYVAIVRNENGHYRIVHRKRHLVYVINVLIRQVIRYRRIVEIIKTCKIDNLINADR